MAHSTLQDSTKCLQGTEGCKLYVQRVPKQRTCLGACNSKNSNLETWTTATHRLKATDWFRQNAISRKTNNQNQYWNLRIPSPVTTLLVVCCRQEHVVPKRKTWKTKRFLHWDAFTRGKLFRSANLNNISSSHPVILAWIKAMPQCPKPNSTWGVRCSKNCRNVMLFVRLTY